MIVCFQEFGLGHPAGAGVVVEIRQTPLFGRNLFEESVAFTDGAEIVGRSRSAVVAFPAVDIRRVDILFAAREPPRVVARIVVDVGAGREGPDVVGTQEHEVLACGDAHGERVQGGQVILGLVLVGEHVVHIGHVVGHHVQKVAAPGAARRQNACSQQAQEVSCKSVRYLVHIVLALWSC